MIPATDMVQMTLGIIAGGGDLPVAIARAAQQAGRPVYLVALEGSARKEDVAPFPHGWASLGQLGRIIGMLKDAGCAELTMAGKVNRPDVAQLKLDARGAVALPRILAAAAKGDDALLRAVLGLFEKEGMRVIGSAQVAGELLVLPGPLGAMRPSPEDETDIAQARQVAAALGALDVGQGAVVCRGLVLAVEAAEGTDAMLKRVAELSPALRGSEAERKGVLVKAPKPYQERRVDLPVIGATTVGLAAAAGLAGIAVEAGATLILDRESVRTAADRAGVFVYGFSTAGPFS